jgi:D-glycero-D-manno-heptose 1,7-bisphosphate phosphatase
MGSSSLKSPLRRCVFLDRDGVLNRVTVRNGKPYPPISPDGLVILNGVPEALSRLGAAGFLCVVVTNQPDVARGTQRREIVEAIHARLLRELTLDDILVCYDDGPNCPRRKPNPGLLLEAAAKHRIDLTASFMVGDRWRDIEAGARAGCRTVFIDYAYREHRSAIAPHLIANSLLAATDWMIAQPRYKGRCA